MVSRARYNTRIVLGAMAVVGVLFLVNLLLSRPSKPSYGVNDRTGSTYSKAPDGCELLFRLLESLDIDAVQHRYPLIEGYVPDATDTIWHTRSSSPGTGKDEVEWLEQWVTAGGTLILVDNPTVRIAASTDSYNEEIEDLVLADWFDKFGLEPVTRELRGPGDQGPISDEVHRMSVRNVGDWELGDVEEIFTYRRRGLIRPVVYRFARAAGSTKEGIAKVTDPYGIVVASLDYGRGRVWMVSDPYVFGNLYVQEPGNSIVAVSMIIESRDGEFSTVLFDEYHLGFIQTRTVADAAATPVGRAILYLGLIAALALGIAGARFGPIRKPPGAIGVSQRAFVRALAGLWMGAGATTAAADALWRRFSMRRDVRRQGLDERLDDLRRGKPRIEELIDVAKNLDSRSQSEK